MIEPTREQAAAAERLALKAQSVRVTPPTEENGPIVVQVTGMPEPMGFTTRAPRVYDLTIDAEGGLVMGVAA